MKHLTTTSPQWPAMWNALADATGDYADCCPETGECWQYMGTFGPVHQFRHRHRPATARPIKGFAGQHRDRVYLELDSATLKVVGVNSRLYVDDTPAGHKRVTAYPRRQEYSGAFDGFTVTSDADPGL